MLIPLRTNRPPRRRPFVTETLIIVNMLVYLTGLIGQTTGVFDREAVVSFGQLSRSGFHVSQLFTYQFLHDPSSIWHLAFNMLFLWVFGCAVEDRMRRPSFLAFYLVGGAVAGIAHVSVSAAPVIGASGAVAAVTGAFLALFPRARIQIVLFFFIIGVYSIPALWFIGFFFAIDVLRQTGELLGGSSARVAYAAHIAGYLYGFSLAFTLLAVGIIKREEFDIFYLFKQSRRRAAFRSTNRDKAGGAWSSASADTSKRLARQREKDRDSRSPAQIAVANARQEITRYLERHDVEGAAARYRELLDNAPEATFPERGQLDLANRLFVDEHYEHAAQAYELLLDTYPSCREATEVRILLAMIYARHLERGDRARTVLAAVKTAPDDPHQRDLLESLQRELTA